MAKTRTVYTCASCGAQSPQWMGRCVQCGAWNSLEETISGAGKGAAEARPQSRPLHLEEITGSDVVRRASGITELDRVLGGGVVAGSLVLVGGDPGVGKSTLMLQTAQRLARGGQRVLYVSGEESAVQLKMRASRLNVDAPDILVYAEVELEQVRIRIDELRPDVVIIDSIQAVFSRELDAVPGSVSQIRTVAGAFMSIAKGRGIPVFLIGHVTKEGWIAGPKMLEHMVDTVLYFEGEFSGAYRVLRAVKNRFGPAGEIGVFEMLDSGLSEVDDPSGIFVQGTGGEYSGSARLTTMEGSRAIMVEVQALVSKTSYSMPRRVSMGIDQSRLSVLLAVMEKRAGIFLSASDVVVNVAGGIRVAEPAVDLAVAMAVASSALDVPLPAGTVCIGEVGLNGELRPVSRLETRLREADRRGYRRALIPEPSGDRRLNGLEIEVATVRRLEDALNVLRH